MEIINAIGSIGTFLMATLYFISVSIQLKQFKMFNSPHISFDQVLIEIKNEKLVFRSMTEEESDVIKTAYKILNVGGAAANNVEISIEKNNQLIQKKFLSTIPPNEKYLLPVSEVVFNEIKYSINNDSNNFDIKIIVKYTHGFSKKTLKKTFVLGIEKFKAIDDKELYEFNFIENN
ncbi:hypothetical protein [Macrococcus animalis]|uniref:hypothetical protein n=1 Tax=Macrococcus animalis TaxID=3395467 RepID=UPI0039BDC77B